MCPWHVSRSQTQRNRVLFLQGYVPLRSCAEHFPHVPSNPPGIQPKRGGHDMGRLPLPVSPLKQHSIFSSIRGRAAGRRKLTEPWWLAEVFSRFLRGGRTGSNEKRCSELGSPHFAVSASSDLIQISEETLLAPSPSKSVLAMTFHCCTQEKTCSVANDYPLLTRLIWTALLFTLYFLGSCILRKA